jgi:hypothetical protein
MPAFAAFTINDGKATPVAHTFNPISGESGLFVWQDQSPTSAIGFLTVTYRLSRPTVAAAPGIASAADRMWKHTIGIAVPTMETLGNNSAGLTPPPTVAHIHRANLEFRQPERGTLADRKDLTAFAYNLLGHASWKSVLNDLTPWTGS